MQFIFKYFLIIFFEAKTVKKIFRKFWESIPFFFIFHIPFWNDVLAISFNNTQSLAFSGAVKEDWLLALWSQVLLPLIAGFQEFQETWQS